MPDDAQIPYDQLIRLLEDSPDHMILERARSKPYFATVPEPYLTGLVVDVVTSGENPKRHEAICMAALSFNYTVGGRVVSAGSPLQLMQEPAIPLPDEVTDRTGITGAMLAGRTIDAEELDQAIGEASLVVAYDAERARPFLEPLCDRFAHVPWGCARTQVPWREEGFKAGRLDELLLQHKLFIDPDLPSARCEAVLDLLARPMPGSGVPALAPLLGLVRQPTFRIWAVGAPSQAREILRAHDYTWNNGVDGRPRAWFKDTAPDRLATEQAFLTSFWFNGAVEPKVQTLDALNRFSERT